MDVILLERVERLGQIGDVVSVKAGYARNFLLPKKKALRATKENLAYFESEKAQIEAINLERRKEAEQVAGKLDDFSVVVIRQAGDSGQLYGSVNARDIAEAVSEAGVTVDRRQIALENVIKSLGLHPVKARLHPEVTVPITVNVARSLDEAEQQAASGRVVTEADREAAELAAEAAIEEVIEEVIAEEEAVEAEAAGDDIKTEADTEESNDEAGEEAAEGDDSPSEEADAKPV
jgi:large subunit ribosomal protein L9